MALTAGHYATDTRTKLNRNQVKGFWAAWGDGMDSFIYALVAVPALLTEFGVTIGAHDEEIGANPTPSVLHERKTQLPGRSAQL
jgi:hypothetical protein